jgi:hypothetical protein
MRLKYEVFMVKGWLDNVAIDEADSEEEALAIIDSTIKKVGGSHPVLELTIRKVWTNSEKP